MRHLGSPRLFAVLIALLIFVLFMNFVLVFSHSGDKYVENYKATCIESGGTPVQQPGFFVRWECLK